MQSAAAIQHEPARRPRLPLLPERVHCPRHETAPQAIRDVAQRVALARLRGQQHPEAERRLLVERARCASCSGRCRQGEPLTRTEALGIAQLVEIGMDAGFVARMARMHGAECVEALITARDPGCGRRCSREIARPA